MNKDRKKVKRYIRRDPDEKFQASTLLKVLLFLGPFMLGIVLFTMYPFINAFAMSFKEGYSILTDSYKSVGLANYTKVLNDPHFKTAFVNTIRYVLIVIPITMAISIVIAVLLNDTKRFKALLQTAYFLPLVTSTAAISLVFKFIFQDSYGLINQILNSLGISTIKFLGSKYWSKIVLYIFAVWNNMPFTIILLLAGLQNIDPQYYTAAKVDGAKPLDIFFNITLPLLAPTIALVLIINSISAFKVFDLVYQLIGDTNNARALGHYTLIYYVYAQMQNFKYGYAAAAAIVLFAIIAVFTGIQNFVQRKWNY